MWHSEQLNQSRLDFVEHSARLVSDVGERSGRALIVHRLPASASPPLQSRAMARSNSKVPCTGQSTACLSTPSRRIPRCTALTRAARICLATRSRPTRSRSPKKNRSRALNFLKEKGPQTSITTKGVTDQIRDDEIVLPDDPRTEAKIGSAICWVSGKVHTFTSPLRLNVNKIRKLTCNQEEKDRLIELGRLSDNLKSRAITVLSARNVFKVMGAAFVVDGKYVFDDYYEGKAIAAGHNRASQPLPKPQGAELMFGTSSGGVQATSVGRRLQPSERTWDPLAKRRNRRRTSRDNT
ncbi:uncharacterized protein JCM10292_005211 [Rhodotorula paludigena]|uniref:uncharacterized protein n=1 Tax=Rhodotorula paludigena TaxID=86838 RepID=UPI003175D0E5